jgi:outer membrane protein TolC
MGPNSQECDRGRRESTGERRGSRECQPELHAELAIDYFELRAADAQQRLFDDTVKAYSDSLELTRARLEGGAFPESDVAQAKTQLDTARDKGARRWMDRLGAADAR